MNHEVGVIPLEVIFKKKTSSSYVCTNVLLAFLLLPSLNWHFRLETVPLVVAVAGPFIHFSFSLFSFLAVMGLFTYLGGIVWGLSTIGFHISFHICFEFILQIFAVGIFLA